MKSYCITIAGLSLLLSACVQPGKFTGTKYPKTKTVDVYHSAAEIKGHYHVIGRLVNGKYPEKEIDQVMVADAKRAGGDGVIMLGVDSTITGKPNRMVAEVIKYDK